MIRPEELRVVLGMLVFALSALLGLAVKLGLEEVADGLTNPIPGWGEPAPPPRSAPPSLGADLVAYS